MFPGAERMKADHDGSGHSADRFAGGHPFDAVVAGEASERLPSRSSLR